jgi:aminopeptidase N
MAHQYWAHQVMSANMQGATVLTETFAQYSALMVMEKEYGRDAMKKFLKYEMDEYLRSRGTERLKELPLLKVENQGYVHYNKGSLVMYYLREMIGEENVNKSLRKLIADHAYKEPPWPVSWHAIDAFRENTPDSLQYIIHDLFETITLYSNRAVKATSEDLGNGKYEVSIDVTSQKFRADSLGRETEIQVNDWIEIGVLGEPEGDKEEGPVLLRQKFHITKKENTFKLIVNKKPSQAGIDPLNLLVDLVGDDNLIRIESEE